jgi:ADP-ribose pyrophosphatase
MKPYILRSKSVLYKNPWWQYCLDQVEFPSGKLGDYHYVLTKGSSMVVAIDHDGRLLLVRQYRYTGNRDSIEFPCGGMKEGSTYEETAINELVEEAGYVAGQLDAAGEFNPCNGLLDEICRVYVARNLRYVGARPDETENFELLRFSGKEIDGMIQNGTIWDGMTIAAWAIAKPKLL